MQMELHQINEHRCQICTKLGRKVCTYPHLNTKYDSISENNSFNQSSTSKYYFPKSFPESTFRNNNQEQIKLNILPKLQNNFTDFTENKRIGLTFNHQSDEKIIKCQCVQCTQLTRKDNHDFNSMKTPLTDTRFSHASPNQSNMSSPRKVMKLYYPIIPVYEIVED